jgi:transposase
MTRKTQKHLLTIVNPHCAGIDIGAREHWVAINPEQSAHPVRCFSTFSDDLTACADWLASEGVEVVAMEATGVYWIPLFEVLDARHARSRGASPMCWTASGSGNSWRMDC